MPSWPPCPCWCWRCPRAGPGTAAASRSSSPARSSPLLLVMPVASRLLQAERSGVELSLVIFDLGGITAHDGGDAFPPMAIGNPIAVNQSCYTAERWDSYSWWVDPLCPIRFETVRAAFAQTAYQPGNLLGRGHSRSIPWLISPTAWSTGTSPSNSWSARTTGALDNQRLRSQSMGLSCCAERGQPAGLRRCSGGERHAVRLALLVAGPVIGFGDARVPAAPFSACAGSCRLRLAVRAGQCRVQCRVGTPLSLLADSCDPDRGGAVRGAMAADTTGPTAGQVATGLGSRTDAFDGRVGTGMALVGVTGRNDIQRWLGPYDWIGLNSA